MVHADAEWAGWGELRQALLSMPAGTWTTYGDLATLIGTHAVAVGSHISTRPALHGAYRVLTADGKISPASAGRKGTRVIPTRARCLSAKACRSTTGAAPAAPTG